MGGQGGKERDRSGNAQLHLRDKKDLCGVGLIFRRSPDGPNPLQSPGGRQNIRQRTRKQPRTAGRFFMLYMSVEDAISLLDDTVVVVEAGCVDVRGMGSFLTHWRRPQGNLSSRRLLGDQLQMKVG